MLRDELSNQDRVRVVLPRARAAEAEQPELHGALLLPARLWHELPLDVVLLARVEAHVAGAAEQLLRGAMRCRGEHLLAGNS